jgi:hypothetical protein
MAFEDAIPASGAAARLLNDPNAEARFIGTHFLILLGLTKSLEATFPALEDEDLRVVMCALTGLRGPVGELLGSTDLFDRIKRVIPRLPEKKRDLESVVWPWFNLSADRRVATNVLLWSLGNRSPKRLIPYLSSMDPRDRSTVARKLKEMPRQDAEVREVLLSLVGDRSLWVREQALEGLAGHKPTKQEAARMETLLTRKAGDLRRGVLSMLLNQTDRAVLVSAERLLTSSRVQQRLAGLDLLRQMVEAERVPEECHSLASQHRLQHPRLTDAEIQVLDLLLEPPQEVATLDNALGLMDPTLRTPPIPPGTRRRIPFLARERPLITPAAVACLRDLDELIHTRGNTPVMIEHWDKSTKEQLLGNIQRGFPRPNPDLPPDEDRHRLPLVEVWEEWWAKRPANLQDDDGLEVLRAWVAHSVHLPRFGVPQWMPRALEILFSACTRPQLGYALQVESILTWLLRLHHPPGAVDLLLDGIEVALALVPARQVDGLTRSSGINDWRTMRLHGWLDRARKYRWLHPDEWDDTHHCRLWELVRWMDEPVPGATRHRPMIEDLLLALQAGGATEADLYDHLLGPRKQGSYGRYFFRDLQRFTGRKPDPMLEIYPTLRDAIDSCRERVLEVEINRGEMPTAASSPALALRHVGGTETLLRLLKALGQESLVRGWTYDSLSKAAVFSHLIRSTTPAESDTMEVFSATVEAVAVSQKRLVQVAVYAPQWAHFVEHALGWQGFADAVWWIHAHTKDTGWRVDLEIRELWNAQISEYTPLSGQQLLDGAVDVKWFVRAHSILGSERWGQVYKVAKLASVGRGHNRAKLFADAMLGRVDEETLTARVQTKRHKDSVRSLGLLPLPEGEEQDRCMLKRYRVLQDFLRTRRQFGSQRQASEKLAATIGLANLARTAGYPDPVRLEWAMEAQETADLIGDGKQVTEGEVTVSLAIDSAGRPEMTVEKRGKALRSVPAALRKDPRIVDLRDRRRELKRQASRMRRSLEQAMVRGDLFSRAELRELFSHPLLAPMLRQLVFVEGGTLGFPAEQGAALQFHDGHLEALKAQTMLRIAHPYDLLATQEWHHWQRECYQAERIQPFKQVFRELYLLTATEKNEETVSRRFAGHQVNPRQALALLGQRGWVNYPEEGVRRTFHDANISAWLMFLQGFFTPAEVEGLTLEGVWFSRRGEWKPLPLVQVPPRLFSEVMRDLDLVVSVAHRGGVNPEASASTTEMRASLIRETCTMLGIDNVRPTGRHVLIEGSLSSYNVHLGSGVVHQQPGGAICIVPVHAQHRGRLFLPFVDDDPKTAEIISKVLLLARDREIKDPTILEQIIGGR